MSDGAGLAVDSAAAVPGPSRPHGRGVPLEVRFWAKVDKADSCWLFTGGGNPKGYGQIYAWGRLRVAHRVSWQMHHGEPPPKGTLVCHTCDVRRCVRPDHLWLGSNADNMRDMVMKGRSAHHSGNTRTQCKRGHDYTDVYTYTDARSGLTSRACRPCKLARQRRRREELKGAA